MAKRLAWVALRDEFIRRKLDGEAISLQQFAKEKGVHPRTVERHAARENWFAAIEDRAREQQRAVEDHSRRVVEQLKFYLNRDEMETRRQHGQAMRDLIDVATRKLEKIDPDSLSVDEMIAILKFAPAQERLALGFPDTPSRINRSAIVVDSPAQREFEENLRRRQKTDLAFAELTAIVEGEQK